jgi:hypothetical protein
VKRGRRQGAGPCAAANATLSVAGAVRPSGGIKMVQSWDPAKGMHYFAQEMDDAAGTLCFSSNSEARW